MKPNNARAVIGEAMYVPRTNKDILTKQYSSIKMNTYYYTGTQILFGRSGKSTSTDDPGRLIFETECLLIVGGANNKMLVNHSHHIKNQ